MREETTVRTHDGLELFLVREQLLRPRGVVLIIHGLCEHQGRYDYLATRLQAQQFNTYRFDHRGHGRSPGLRTHLERWTDLSDDVMAVFRMIQAENPGLPVYMLGHSMGGQAAACFATRFPGLAQGFILSAAPTRYHRELVGPLPLDMPGDSYILFEDDEEGTSPVTDKTLSYAADPLVQTKFTAGLMNAIGEGIQYLKSNAERFEDPVLILHGHSDELVAEQDSLELFSEIAAEDRSLRIYAGLAHDLFEEIDRDEVIQDTISWLNRRVRPGSRR